MRLEEKLVCLRREQHITQLELAEKLDVSRQAISKWELGTAVPSTENLIRLSQLYGVPVDLLVNHAMDLPNAPESPSAAPPQNSAPPEFQKQATGAWVRLVAAVCVFMLGFWIGACFFSSRPLENEPNPVIQIGSLERKLLDPSPKCSFSLLPPK